MICEASAIHAVSILYIPGKMSYRCVCQLLREIPPDGDKFATMVEVGHVLDHFPNPSFTATQTYLYCCVSGEYIYIYIFFFFFFYLTAYSQHRGELEQLEERGMSKLCERKVKLYSQSIDMRVSSVSVSVRLN